MSQIKVNTITDEAGTGATAFPNGLTAQDVPVFGGDPDNRIINGAFDFWQRGTSSTASGYVAADRWRNGGIGGTRIQSRQLFPAGFKIGSNNPTFYLRQTVSGQSAAGDAALIQQSIEGVRSYADETITVLGWARRNSGSGNVVVEGVQNFGTGGSPSSDVTAISPTTITLTADFEPFAAALTIPSIAGKTLGTNNDRFTINFWTSAGSDFNARANSLGIQTIGVDLWGIHIKRGVHTADATEAYRAPELGPELARCQRYYETGFVKFFANSISSPVVVAQNYRVVKRAATTLAYSAPPAGGFNAPSSLEWSTTSGFSANSGGAAALEFSWAADAEL